MDNKMLLIVDPQIDFITGSLPVPGAEDAMDALAEYIRTNHADYRYIVVTADRHPMRHISFRLEGGEWPPHCVEDTVGAAVWPPIMNLLTEIPDKVIVLHKGEDAMREEYSIFKNSVATERILGLIESGSIGLTDICGLSGDVCVSDTVCDGHILAGMSEIRILTEFSPSIDGGKRLESLISKFGLSAGL